MKFRDYNFQIPRGRIFISQLYNPEIMTLKFRPFYSKDQLLDHEALKVCRVIS